MQEDASNINLGTHLVQNERDIYTRALLEKLDTEGQMLLEHERDKFNTYASNKSVSQGLLNTSMIQAHIGILVSLFALRRYNTPLNGFEITTITLICCSLVLQFVIFCILVLLMKTTRDTATRSCTATMLNNAVTSLSGLGLILNIAITTTSVINTDTTTNGNVTRMLSSTSSLITNSSSLITHSRVMGIMSFSSKYKLLNNFIK